MFWKILRKDLKRKKTMNILLFIFIIMTATLLGASINMLSTNSTVVKRFIKTAKVPDFTAITYHSEEASEKVRDWTSQSNNIKDYSMEEVLLLMKEDITLPEGTKPLEFDNAMVLINIPQDNNLLFDENDAPLAVEDGEIAIPYGFVSTTGLRIGDKVTITIAGQSKELTVSHYIKDAFCGSPMMGFKRWAISGSDYEYFDTEKAVKFDTLEVNKKDGIELNVLASEFNQLGIPVLSTITNDLVETSYLMNTMIAGILMVISFLLILISFLILRFTIGFTLQEDYKEIGIMKAIGLKNSSVQGIYMVKYLAMAIIGGIVGYLLSLPMSVLFINAGCKEMVSGNTSWWSIPSLIGVLVVIILTMIFCRLCTRKLNTFSAIDAIRGGSTGERYHKLKSFHLKKWRTGPTTFLAVSDLFYGARKNAALFLSFILATVVLIVPLNMINTLKSSALLDMFAYPEFDFTVNTGITDDIMFTYSTEEMLVYVENLEKEYRDKGVQIDLYPQVNYMSQVYKDDSNDSMNIYSSKFYGMIADEYKVNEGRAPKLKNEIAVTKKIAEYFHVGIGDYLHLQIGDTPEQYLITGTYSSMINLGESIQLPEDAEYKLEGSTGIVILGRYLGNESEKTFVKQLRDAIPDNRVKTAVEYFYEMMGNIVDTLDQVNIGILVIVVCITFLITVLVAKMLLTKEASDIAVLKSLGYKSKNIRSWQIKRMILLLMVAIIVGTILAGLIDEPAASLIFSVVGMENAKLAVDPIQVYLIYPGILLVCTVLATLISTMDVRKIHVWELNNQE